MKAEAVPWTQFGFRVGHSTVDALTVFRGQIEDSRKRHKFMAVASLDIKKAFDSVWHRGLVHKVSRAGCDTLLSCSSLNAYHAAKVVGRRIEEVGEYLDNWGIEINAEETDFMIVGPRGKSV